MRKRGRSARYFMVSLPGWDNMRA